LAALLPTLIFLAAALVALPDVGISVDEPLHQLYGDGLVRYYATLGEDQSLFESFHAAYYGGLYDLVGELRGRGVVVRARSLAGLAEEMPWAYKDVADVVDVVDRAGLATRVARLRPLAVVKG